jgi:hypothetical protein
MKKIYCKKVEKIVPISSATCYYEQGKLECRYRAEEGCALYSIKEDPLKTPIRDLCEVLEKRRKKTTYDAVVALSKIPYVIGGRDAVSVYTGKILGTARTDFFTKSLDKERVWRELKKFRFRVEPVDPTYCVASKGSGSVEVHYASSPPEYVDEETIKRASVIEFFDRNVLIQPLEELIAYKSDRGSKKDIEDLKAIFQSEIASKIDRKYLRKVAEKRKLSLDILKKMNRKL